MLSINFSSLIEKLSIIVLILGVLIVTVPAGLSATSLMKAREIQEEQERNKKSGTFKK